MAIANTDPIAPVEIIVPTLPWAEQLATAQTGSIAISGATLIVHNGTAFVAVGPQT